MSHFPDIGCHVTHSVDQSIANATITALAFDTERYDTDTMHDTAVNNSRITFRTRGKYEFTGLVAWAANIVGLRDIFVRLNGATIIAVAADSASTAVGFPTDQVVTGEYLFAAADYIELMVLQISTAALAVSKFAEYSPEFMARKVG